MASHEQLSTVHTSMDIASFLGSCLSPRRKSQGMRLAMTGMLNPTNLPMASTAPSRDSSETGRPAVSSSRHRSLTPIPHQAGAETNGESVVKMSISCLRWGSLIAHVGTTTEISGTSRCFGSEVRVRNYVYTLLLQDRWTDLLFANFLLPDRQTYLSVFEILCKRVFLLSGRETGALREEEWAGAVGR